jgi:UDP-N-acetylmuramoylalanine--D-glutamate ligase
VSRRVVVSGFGVTGQSVARMLVQSGDEVLVLDDRPTEEQFERAGRLGVTLQPTPDRPVLDSLIADRDLMIPSPGFPAEHRLFEAARAANLTVWSEIELAAERARAAGRPRIVAITGTNGKTTVTTMVTGILDSSGVKAIAAGNIGRPLIEAVDEDVEVVVAEVSSFQLQHTYRFHPSVSCWLNFAEDHLDWHPTVEHYRSAKARIWANQGPGDFAVLNADDDAVMASAVSVPEGVARVCFSTSGPADYSLDGDRLVGPDAVELARTSDLPRALPHDLANALAAAAVSTAAGATAAQLRDGIASWQPLPHRVSFVGEAGGVAWYDDSKATTPASVIAAVAGFSSVVLIAGGRNKGLDLSGLRAVVPPVRVVIAIGEAAGEIERTFAPVAEVVTAGSMRAAVEAAAAHARPGDAVLLSPGCASFDWYQSYAERGDDFVQVVNEQLRKKGEPC